MDALFQTQSNELSTITQKEKLFKDAERQWNTLSSEKGAPGRKVDFEIYKSILYNLEIRKVYLDSKLSLEKFSSIVGTNTTYLSNAVNNYFGCNFKRLINSYRVVRAKELLDSKDCPVSELFSRCGFASKSVFYVAFRKVGETEWRTEPTPVEKLADELWLGEKFQSNTIQRFHRAACALLTN